MPDNPGSDAAPKRAAATLLELMWLASPALPVGGFSYSEGLEAAVDRGLVTDESGVAAWLVDQLHLGLARSDLVVVAAAFDAWRRDDVAAAAALNGWFASTRESAEFAQQAAQTGRSLVQWLKTLYPATAGLAALEQFQPAPLWPVAFALAAARTGAVLEDALLAFAFGWAENMVQAAVRGVPLGQSGGQRVLAALAAEITSAVGTAAQRLPAERQAYTPGLAIVSAQHESQYSRLFRS